MAVIAGVAVPVSAASSGSAATGASITPFSSGVTRLSGSDRYRTAISVSERFAPGVPAAFVATGSNFPDALSAASAAAQLGGPLLLTKPTQPPSAVTTELKRLQPKHIYVVGGTSVISAGVESSLSKIATTDRLSGANRYATSNAIVRTVFPQAAEAIVATGQGFADALAATGAAGARHAPIMLVDGDKNSVSADTLALIKAEGVQRITIAGGTAAVSAGIERQLSALGITVTRYGGATRYQTAAMLNTAYFPAGSSGTVFLASGANFPDALAGGALAGALGAPLELSTRTCVDPTVGDQLSALNAASTVVVGGTTVLTSSAAIAARCVYPVTNEPLSGWATTGWTLPSTSFDAYSGWAPSATAKVDSTGLLIYTRADTGTRADHPVAYAQYGIESIEEYQRTGDKLWLDRAIRQADQLIAIHTTSRGAWWYPYNFPWTYFDRTMRAPWYSGMAQGQALSLFVRLAEVTGDKTWDTAADNTFASFTLPYSATQPWVSLNIDNHLYFEEYAGNQPPLLVVNGHIYAAFGIYDYWQHTGNATAERYFDGAATTVLDRMMPIARVPGGISYYCVQYEYCQVPGFQHASYHTGVAGQLADLAKETGDSSFQNWANLLTSDWSPTTSAKSASGTAASGSGSSTTSPAPGATPAPSQDSQFPDLGTW